MLEKMGWKEGKGLGANEDGITEHIKIRKRPENQGIGVDTSNPSKNWLTTSVAYDSILANLNASYSSKVQTTGNSPFWLVVPAVPLNKFARVCSSSCPKLGEPGSCREAKKSAVRISPCQVPMPAAYTQAVTPAF